MYKHRGKIVIKLLQGSVVTQTALDGQTIYYEYWLAVDKLIAKNIRLTFLAHSV